MTRGQRHAHVVIWIVVGLAAAVFIAAGLAVRPAPAENTLPPALTEAR